MRTNTKLLPRWTLAAAASALLGGSLLACHSGTPAAPEGTKIIIEQCAYNDATRDFGTGNFQARVVARVLDEDSNVPQTGVGVFFLVESGPGVFLLPSPVVTNNSGIAQNTLEGTGAVRGNTISVQVFSGDAVVADIEIDVANCDAPAPEPNQPPSAVVTVSPTDTGINTDVTVNVSGSSDAECPGGDPTKWSVDWDDGTVQQDIPFSNVDEVHRYTQTGTFDVKVTVEDCEGATSDDTTTVTIR